MDSIEHVDVNSVVNYYRTQASNAEYDLLLKVKVIENYRAVIKRYIDNHPASEKEFKELANEIVNKRK